LNEVKIPVSVDSTTKRALTQELVEIAKGQLFSYGEKNYPQAPIAVISPEMSSLLASDPKGIIELLTDLYDAGESWKYRTSGSGYDYLYRVCVSAFIATTPQWFANNLPPEAIGGGYSSRNIIITETEKYKSVPIPPRPNKKLMEDLIHDLNCVATLVGPFQWGEGTQEFFEEWYNDRLPALQKETKDDRLHYYLGRIHVCAIKTAMALHVARSDDLVLEADDVGRAVFLLESALKKAPEAFGGHGRSKYGPDTEKIRAQIRVLRRVTFTELLKKNYMNLTRRELIEILDSLAEMGLIGVAIGTDGKPSYVWKGD